MKKLLNFDINDEDMTKNELVTRWPIPTARNILHSRTRIDANKRMDKSVVGSSTDFLGSTKRTLCGIVLFKLNTFFSLVFACP